MTPEPWWTYLDLIWEATQETVYMVFWSFLISLVLGIVLGVALYLTAPGSRLIARIDSPAVRRTVLGAHHTASVLVNIARSLPFVVLLIAILPFTRAVAGTTLGVTAALVPLTLSVFPYFARIVDNALGEIDAGRLEAVDSMGVTGWQLVTKVLLPEARSGLIAGATLTLVGLIGYSTIAGTIGAGGLGDFAVKYGYQRFNTELMIATVVVLIVLVQLIQIAGDTWLRRIAHTR